jgi:hypothetical protein
LVFLVNYPGVFFLMSAIKILSEYERGVIFRLGRALDRAKGPGIIILIPHPRPHGEGQPPAGHLRRSQPGHHHPGQCHGEGQCGGLFPGRRLHEGDYRGAGFYAATQLLAQTTLRSVCGQSDLDDLLSEREKINAHIAEILDKHTDPWGIKVTLVELKAIDLPIEMQRAMAKQAEAERERRAKVINAEGEYQAAAKMAEAAHVLATEPISLQLRYLQTLREIAAENNSTTLFPIPIDLFRPFMKMYEKMEEGEKKEQLAAVSSQQSPVAVSSESLKLNVVGRALPAAITLDFGFFRKVSKSQKKAQSLKLKAFGL